MTVTLRGIRFGESEHQEGDLYIPESVNLPVVCLLHGGFWKMPYGRDQMVAIAESLATRGFAVWNLEYRRLGAPGAGWPSTMMDVATGIDHLAQLSLSRTELNLERVIVVGHSAGGHLALWASARQHSIRVRIFAAAGLAPIADLTGAYESRVGGDVVSKLMGGTPAEHPKRYRAASPMEMLPLGVAQAIFHGTADDAVPIELTRRYVDAARASGDSIELIELAGTGHMEYLDPASHAFAALLNWLTKLCGVNPPIWEDQRDKMTS